MPGFPPGGETGGGGWGLWVTGPAPGKSLQYAFGTQFFSNMLYNNAAWDFHTFNVDRDVKAADDKMAPILNATDPDLTRFQGTRREAHPVPRLERRRHPRRQHD